MATLNGHKKLQITSPFQWVLSRTSFMAVSDSELRKNCIQMFLFYETECFMKRVFMALLPLHEYFHNLWKHFNGSQEYLLLIHSRKSSTNLITTRRPSNQLLLFEAAQIKSNILVKHNGTVGRLKPCKIRVEGAWKSGKGRGRTMLNPAVAWKC